jgi:uncharacterized protein DUF4286
MIRYEVTLQVDPTLAPAVEQHMRRDHIPEIVASGCFSRIRFARASAGRFRTSYEARSQADLDRYLQDHAPKLRAEFQARFPTGVTITREIWAEQEVWE